MKKFNKQKFFYSILVAAVLASSVYGILKNVASAYDKYCNEECQAAEARANESSAKAKEAKEVATDLAGYVSQLNSEIAVIETEMVKTQENINRLTDEINETENRLNAQQATLAELLVQLHFEGKIDPIKMLASSNSLSDFAGKQARLETIKTQVNLSAQAVKTAKEQLETDRTQVEASLRAQEIKRSEIATKRREQNDLKLKYEADAANFTADAEEARRIKAKAIAEEIAKYNVGGTIVDAGTNSYPWRNRCPQDNLKFMTSSGYGCQCTSYAGYKAYEFWRVTISAWGDARHWGDSAKARGYKVDDNPEPFTVGYNTKGAYGHVVWVESVNGNGTINLSEYNYIYGDYSYRAGVPASTYRYIHFN